MRSRAPRRSRLGSKEVELREKALGDRADALDKREADIAADAARRSAELDDRQAAIEAREANLKDRAARVAAAMSAA